MAHVEPQFPWVVTADMLNALVGDPASASASASARWLAPLSEFPGTGGDKEGETARAGQRRRPLPDDFILRGFQWAEKYFPDKWFKTEERIDDDDKSFEVPSMVEQRRDRVVRLGRLIAGEGKWLLFDEEKVRFSCAEPGWLIVDSSELSDADTVP